MKNEMCSALLVLLCVFVRKSVLLPEAVPSEHHKRNELNDAIICQQNCQPLWDPNRNDTARNNISSCLEKCLSEGVVKPTMSHKIHASTNRIQTDAVTSYWCNASNSAAWKGNTGGDIIPGAAQDIDVTFLKKIDTWYAKISWSLPKGVKLTDQWKGYVVFWSSSGRLYVSCQQILDKSATEFLVRSGDGWNYPAVVYIAVIGVPSALKGTVLVGFSPVKHTVSEDLAPPTTEILFKKRKPNEWMLLGTFFLAIGLLCCVTALLLRLTKWRKKDAWESKTKTVLVMATPGTSNKKSSQILSADTV